jgi:predicted RecB family nuclease
MKQKKNNLRVCRNGHRYYKTSDCPTCPECERERKPEDGFLSVIAAPARRALERKGITTIGRLSRFSRKEILNLHGMGPAAVSKLQRELKKNGLSFKKY